jgi:hypothetical protein
MTIVVPDGHRRPNRLTDFTLGFTAFDDYFGTHWRRRSRADATGYSDSDFNAGRAQRGVIRSRLGASAREQRHHSDDDKPIMVH